MSSLDSCTDACGWVFAFVAAVSYGTYGVPIKHTKHIDVDPFVFQSYKTLVMFATCWGVKLLGEEISFTRWGLLSGFMWIVGGVGGIYGIRMAGLAIAVGTWASIMVIINFCFGILVFQEPVANVWGTLCSFILLIIGLVGMSHYSSPQQQQNLPPEILPPEETPFQTLQVANDEEIPSDEDTEEIILDEPSRPPQGHQDESKIFLVIWNGRISLTRRQCGILGAVFNGIMTGGSLIPLHYAAEEGFGGAKFFPSYGVGAMIANTLMWLLLYMVCLGRGLVNGKPIRQVLDEMPKWYLDVLWFPALSAGLMLSLAMFSTILAITYLGQGVGNSIVQSKILVSGLWGIFWYKEVVGAKTVAKWFASAGICMVAIIWLSWERLEAKKANNY